MCLCNLVYILHSEESRLQSSFLCDSKPTCVFSRIRILPLNLDKTTKLNTIQSTLKLDVCHVKQTGLQARLFW